MTRKNYRGPIVDVSFDGAVCQHAAECVRGMPSVFDTSLRPWINPAVADTTALADQLRNVVARCPSGALAMVEHPTQAGTENG
jgi:uncharacterized Fe-S cluster protein YjdI